MSDVTEVLTRAILFNISNNVCINKLTNVSNHVNGVFFEILLTQRQLKTVI